MNADYAFKWPEINQKSETIIYMFEFPLGAISGIFQLQNIIFKIYNKFIFLENYCKRLINISPLYQTDKTIMKLQTSANKNKYLLLLWLRHKTL